MAADAVNATATDALRCKASAAALGYTADEFALQLAGERPRRPPLVNRAYAARVAVVDAVVARWAAAHNSGDQPPQLLSLGSGVDSLALRHPGLAAFEVDLPAVIAARRAASPPSPAALVEADLADAAGVLAALRAAGADFARPTLCVAECVLAYVDPAAVEALLARLSAELAQASLVAFEPLAAAPGCAYGEQLLACFAAKGCPLRGALRPEAHVARLQRAGWRRPAALDMHTAFLALAPPEAHARANVAEPFDELGDLLLVQRQYVLLVAGADCVAGCVRGVGFAVSPARHAGAARALFEATFAPLAARHASVRRFVEGARWGVESGDLWVAEDSATRELLGCVALAARGPAQPGVGEIKRLCVAPAARRRGVASALLATARAAAAAAGLHTLALETLSVLGAALDFYAAHGFEETGRIRLRGGGEVELVKLQWVGRS